MMGTFHFRAFSYFDYNTQVRIAEGDNTAQYWPNIVPRVGYYYGASVTIRIGQVLARRQRPFSTV